MIKSNLPTSSPCTIRMQGTRDTVQVYDPYKKTFLDWQQSGVIALPSTITITTTTLEGQAVICQIGEYSKTTTFIDGVAYFDMIFGTGTATITCGEWSTTVEVTEQGGSFSGELEESTDIIIFKDGAPQNGATYGSDYILSYINSESMWNRKICFTFKQDVTQRFVTLYVWANNSMYCGYYLDPTGRLYDSRFDMNSYNYPSGKTYSYSIEQMLRATSGISDVSGINANQIKFYVYNSTSVNVINETNLDKVWLE